MITGAEPDLMGIDFQGCLIRSLVTPGPRSEGSGLKIIPSFGQKYINKEGCIY